MTIRLSAHAWQGKSEDIILLPVFQADQILVSRLFRKKGEWEERRGKEFFVQAKLELNYGKRTFKQNSAVWVLVTAIFESAENRKPAEEEKYNLYLDLLELYAPKVPNKLTGGMRPVHISESNTLEGSQFIDGLLYHLATECNLSYGVQSTVQEVLQEWEQWRGGLEKDPADYSDNRQTEMLTEAEWREKHIYSEASGRGGGIERAHIVSRGTDHADIEKSWNWIALLHEEHMEQHRIGWENFLQIYPHLRGRVESARKMAGKLELKTSPKTTRSLALEALEL
jgi:hypothetical protein